MAHTPTEYQKNLKLLMDEYIFLKIPMCSINDYERISDFEWYMNVLLEIHLYGVKSNELSQQLLTIALRVESIRPGLFGEMIEIMKQPSTYDAELIETASFILGEYSSDEVELAFTLLLGPKINSVGVAAQTSCIQKAFKIYTKSKDESTLKKRGAFLIENLTFYASSRITEVQDRATMLLSLVSIFQSGPDVSTISSLYSVPLKAIASTAQSKVPIPKSLDLSAPIINLEVTEQLFDFIDELGFETNGNNGPDPSIFILGSKIKKNANQQLQISNISL